MGVGGLLFGDAVLLGDDFLFCFLVGVERAEHLSNRQFEEAF